MDEPSRVDEHLMVWGLFDPTIALSSVVDQLRHRGIPDDWMEVMSSFPLEKPLLNKPAGIPLHWITILGGLVGIGIGLFFAGGTALLYPLTTGGKPIVSLPVLGIVSFETMMLVAIVLTFSAMVVKIACVKQSGLRHDPRIDEGAVGLSIQVGSDSAKAQSISRLLEEAGASEVEIRTIEKIR